MSIFKGGGGSLLFAYCVLAGIGVSNTLQIGHYDRRTKALEVRLQNVEHLFSLFISESRSPALIGRTNRVFTASDETK